jgi:hypothetical protein
MSNMLCDIYWKTPLKFIEDVCVNIFIITLDIFIKVILDEMSLVSQATSETQKLFLPGLSHSNFLILSEFRRCESSLYDQDA